MQVTIDVPAARIADLLTTAIESGDPVTTAARGGWCTGIYWKARGVRPPDHCWYNQSSNFIGDFDLQIVELADESTGKEVAHNIDEEKVAKGLSIMATKYGHLFKQIMTDNIDAPCADIFLQCVCFGEEKYA